MPKTSKETASNVIDIGILEERSEDLGGYVAGFTHFREDGDATPVFRGLPDDRCQSHHWGYVFSGKVTFRYAGHDEIYEAGDAYYAPPGAHPCRDRRNRGRRVQLRSRVPADAGGRRPEHGSPCEVA